MKHVAFSVIKSFSDSAQLTIYEAASEMNSKNFSLSSSRVLMKSSIAISTENESAVCTTLQHPT